LAFCKLYEERRAARNGDREAFPTRTTENREWSAEKRRGLIEPCRLGGCSPVLGKGPTVQTGGTKEPAMIEKDVGSKRLTT